MSWEILFLINSFVKLESIRELIFISSFSEYLFTIYLIKSSFSIGFSTSNLLRIILNASQSDISLLIYFIINSSYSSVRLAAAEGRSKGLQLCWAGGTPPCEFICGSSNEGSHLSLSLLFTSFSTHTFHHNSLSKSTASSIIQRQASISNAGSNNGVQSAFLILIAS
jgi:hypothetical protein